MSEEKENELVDITIPPQSSIKLVKYAKGYGWEIKFYSDNLDVGFDKIVEMNKRLREEFGQSE